MTPDEEDRIRRAEEIQRYTENRCEALEKENKELKEQINTVQTSLEMYRLDVIAILTSMGIKDEFDKQMKQFQEYCNKPWSD